MKTVVFAYHNIGCNGIKALLENGFDIQAVFTHKDDENENIWYDSVAQVASNNKINVFAPDDVNHMLWVEKIKKLDPDIIFSFYYRDMIKKPILDIPKKGCFNLHGSLLPKYRGRCPVNWAIINGENVTGVTLHHMTEKPDDGDIVSQKQVTIEKNDTSLSLHNKMAKAAYLQLNEILPDIKKGKIKRIIQDNSKATYYGARKPEDGEIDWSLPASSIKNLVRAVSHPYPGAFSYVGRKKCLFWEVTPIDNETVEADLNSKPGTIICLDPLIISCGKESLRIDLCQPEDDVCISGSQLSSSLGLVKHMAFGQNAEVKFKLNQKKRVLILGVDGFIGNALTEKLLNSGKYYVDGMDLHSKSIERFLDNDKFTFYEGDIAISREWIEYHVRKCDIIVPLVAIATPIEYTRNPLKVFQLDFEENLRIVRYCVKYKKRIIFPSTSEVYGMCTDEEFDEDNSTLMLGPIRMQRWIYSCSKQLLDRVIWAYGQKEGLKFTLFRPFNWIGPRLDSLESARIGSSRLITQLILNLVEGTPINLIDGGEQKRCFTDVSDGIEGLYRIIENIDNKCDGKIINIGNPDNEASVKELAQMIVKQFCSHPMSKKLPHFSGYCNLESKAYYGSGYQDVQHRKPSIKNAKKYLDWEPKVGIEKAVYDTLDFFLRDAF